MRSIIAALLCVAVCGCYPVRPWHDDAELIAQGDAKHFSAMDLEQSLKLVDGLNKVLLKSSNDRRTAELFLSETLFYGSVVAAVGVLKDSRAARNTGGGVAALSSLLGAHYQLSDQRVAFGNALKRAVCLADTIAPIDEATRAKFSPDFDGDGELASAFDQIGPETRSTVEAIGSALDASLLAISLPTPNKDQLSQTLGALSEAKENADDKAKAIKPGDTGARSAFRTDAEKAASAAADADAKRRFSTAVLTYKATLATCLVEHPQ